MENGSIVFVPQLDTEDDFWDVIRTFENDVLSCNNLFVSSPPSLIHNQSNGSSSSFLDSSLSPGSFLFNISSFFLYG